MRVSVVLAAHNEAATIAEVIRGCRQHTPFLVEVLVVDDGSSDRTAQEAEGAGARVLRLAVNQGKGAALRRGIEEAEGDTLVFLDADGQDDPADIPRLVEALKPGVELVIGSRFLGSFEPGAITALNRAGTHFLNGAFNVLFRARVTDCLAGFRAARRAPLLRAPLRARRYDIEVDLLAAVLQQGGRVVEVPVRRQPRRHGQSGLRSFRDGTRILLAMARKRCEMG
jgi:glycosyltransferase involved in cell wall biosynthesis